MVKIATMPSSVNVLRRIVPESNTNPPKAIDYTQFLESDDNDNDDSVVFNGIEHANKQHQVKNNNLQQASSSSLLISSNNNHINVDQNRPQEEARVNQNSIHKPFKKRKFEQISDLDYNGIINRGQAINNNNNYSIVNNEESNDNSNENENENHNEDCNEELNENNNNDDDDDEEENKENRIVEKKVDQSGEEKINQLRDNEENVDKVDDDGENGIDIIYKSNPAAVKLVHTLPDGIPLEDKQCFHCLARNLTPQTSRLCVRCHYAWCDQCSVVEDSHKEYYEKEAPSTTAKKMKPYVTVITATSSNSSRKKIKLMNKDENNNNNNNKKGRMSKQRKEELAKEAKRKWKCWPCEGPWLAPNKEIVEKHYSWSEAYWRLGNMIHSYLTNEIKDHKLMKLIQDCHYLKRAARKKEGGERLCALLSHHRMDFACIMYKALGGTYQHRNLFLRDIAVIRYNIRLVFPEPLHPANVLAEKMHQATWTNMDFFESCYECWSFFAYDPNVQGESWFERCCNDPHRIVWVWPKNLTGSNVDAEKFRYYLPAKAMRCVGRDKSYWRVTLFGDSAANDMSFNIPKSFCFKFTQQPIEYHRSRTPEYKLKFQKTAFDQAEQYYRNVSKFLQYKPERVKGARMVQHRASGPSYEFLKISNPGVTEDEAKQDEQAFQQLANSGKLSTWWKKIIAKRGVPTC